MNTVRKLVILLFSACLIASTGCATVMEAILNGLVDHTYERQYADGRAAGGLTRAEKRARFEEQSIRHMLRDRAYSEEGRVPTLPYH